MAQTPSEVFNALPFETRKSLAIGNAEMRVLTLKSVRSKPIRHHKAALHEIDDWIKNLEKEYQT